MNRQLQTVVRIDVGGEKKGFHAVALRGEYFVDVTAATDPFEVFDWCLAHEPSLPRIASVALQLRGASSTPPHDVLEVNINLIEAGTYQSSE